MAQSVKRLTLGLSSGHDLTVREFEPQVRLCADTSDPEACFGFCVSLSLSTPPLLTLCLSLSKINNIKINKGLLTFFFKNLTKTTLNSSTCDSCGSHVRNVIRTLMGRQLKKKLHYPLPQKSQSWGLKIGGERSINKVLFGA